MVKNGYGQSGLFYAGTNSCQLKSDRKCYRLAKCVWSVMWQDSKNDCIYMNSWNKLIFCMLIQIRKN